MGEAYKFSLHLVFHVRRIKIVLNQFDPLLVFFLNRFDHLLSFVLKYFLVKLQIHIFNKCLKLWINGERLREV